MRSCEAHLVGLGGVVGSMVLKGWWTLLVLCKVAGNIGICQIVLETGAIVWRCAIDVIHKAALVMSRVSWPEVLAGAIVFLGLVLCIGLVSWRVVHHFSIFSISMKSWWIELLSIIVSASWLFHLNLHLHALFFFLSLLFLGLFVLLYHRIDGLLWEEANALVKDVQVHLYHIWLLHEGWQSSSAMFLVRNHKFVLKIILNLYLILVLICRMLLLQWARL